MGDPKICMKVSDKEPWVAPYDLFNGTERKPDGQIGDDDLKAWRDSLPQGDQMVIQSLPAQFNCQLFTYSMVHKRFLFEHAKPEIERARPLTDTERRENASQAGLASVHGSLELLENLRNFNQRKPASEMSQEEFTQDLVMRNFVEDRRESLYAAAIEILMSLNYETSKLAGMGLRFEKEVGKPALLTAIKDVSTGKNNAHLEPWGTWIVAVDGKEILEMSFEEVRNLMRGPADSEVTLTVSPIGSNQEAVTVRLKRVLFSQSLL